MSGNFRRLTVCWAGAIVALTVAASPSLAQNLMVATDSSFGDAMKAVVRDFEAGHTGVSVKVQSGASGALLEQIGRGMTADVLAGADVQTVELGEQRRLLPRGLHNVFATNTLVLVVPALLKVPVQRLSDLTRPEVMRIAMARPTSVPAGRLAREVINAQRLWSSLQPKVVITEDVRDVLELVARSDVEAGFVYASDVGATAGRVRVVETLSTSTPIRHLATVVAGSKNPVLASEFVAYLSSAPARTVFKQSGFGLP